MNRICKKHGDVKHYAQKSGNWRCQQCAIEAVTKRRQRVKEILVKEHGGCCNICGYNKCIQALQFHHMDPEEKEFKVATSSTKSIDKLRREAKKCILLCANCHIEEHYCG